MAKFCSPAYTVTVQVRKRQYSFIISWNLVFGQNCCEKRLKTNKQTKYILGWCGSLAWALACKLEGQIACSIPSQGTCLGCRPGLLMVVCSNRSIFLSLLLPPSPSLSKWINKMFKKWNRKSSWKNFYCLCTSKTFLKFPVVIKYDQKIYLFGWHWIFKYSNY